MAVGFITMTFLTMVALVWWYRKATGGGMSEANERERLADDGRREDGTYPIPHDASYRDVEAIIDYNEGVFRRYRRTAIAEVADWRPGFDMGGVSISDADRESGSPRLGDKIARNPKNHDDKWLIAADYFADNFEPPPTPAPERALREADTKTLIAAAEYIEDAAEGESDFYRDKSHDDDPDADWWYGDAIAARLRTIAARTPDTESED